MLVIDLQDAYLTDETRLVQVVSVNATDLLCEDSVAETLETIQVADVGRRWRRIVWKPESL